MADYQSVISGCLDNLPTLNSRLVRIFISSTFTDTKEERNLLLEDVYPRLKAYCKEKHGLDFQLVDMRWGVPVEAVDDHQATRLCLQEINNCQRLSTGPNFVTFLNQKHGYRPLQVTIPQAEFENLTSCLRDHGKATTLVDTWYLKDENAEPPVYVLQPITSLIPGYKGKNNDEAKKQWNDVFTNLREDFKFASKMCRERGLISEEEQHKYFMSVTEDEIFNGILKANGKVEDQCLCFVRIIEDITDHLDHSKAWRFIDMVEPKVIDEEAQTILSRLRDEKVAKRLQNFNITRNVVRWSPQEGINQQDHGIYLEAFRDSFYNSVTSLVDKAVKAEKVLTRDDLYIEVLQHATMATKRCAIFHGREDILKQVGEYLCGNHGYPLLLYGPSGCGKTSIMAQTAKLIPQMYKKTAVVVLRFLGTSPDSSNLLLLLRNLCEQIAVCYGRDRSQVPEELDTLKDFLVEELLWATADKPLVLLLDSLDQLSHEHHALKLNWLPWKLPKHVRIIVSVYSDEETLMSTLKRMHLLDCSISIPVFSLQLSETVLQAWLKKKQRTLTRDQLAVVEKAFSYCTLPLYVKLIFDQVVLWTSYQPLTECSLAFTIQESIDQLFSVLEKKHGQMLVSRALAYVTASRTGISETELEDLLSLDDVVLSDLFQIHVPPLRRIPPLLWVRIRHDISEYLVDKEMDEVRVFFWYHRQFFETAAKRYLSNKQFAREIHSLMADYYQGKWHQVKKPFKYTPEQMRKLGVTSPDGEADRKIAAQPLVFTQAEEGEKKRYNKRKLNKMPYHLHKAGRQDELKKDCLANYKWLQTKLDAASVQQLLLDFTLFGEEDSIIHKCIKGARSTLKAIPGTLAMELAGRLLALTALRVSDQESQVLQETLTELETKTRVVPYQPCYSIPSESQLYQIEYPKVPFRCRMVAISSDSQHLAILSTQNEVLIWDLESGEMECTVPMTVANEEKLNVMCRAAGSDSVVVGTTYQKQVNPVFVVDINNGAVESALTLEKNYPTIGFVDDLKLALCEKVLLVLVVGQAGDVFDKQSGKLLHEFDIKPDQMELIGGQTMVIYHVKQSNIYTIYSLETFEFVYQVSCQGSPKSIHIAADSDIGCILLDNPPAVQFISTAPHRDQVGKTLDSIPVQKYTSAKVLAAEVQKDFCVVTTLTGFLLWNHKLKRLTSHCGIPASVIPGKAKVLEFEGFLTPDESLLVAGYENNVVVWDALSGKVMHTTEVSRSAISKVLISPSGEYLVTTTRRNNIVMTWNLSSMMTTARQYTPLSMKNSARYVTLAGTGKVAVVRSHWSDEFAVIDIATGSIRCHISEGIEARSPQVSWDGRYAVLREYTQSEEALKVWDLSDGKLVTAVPISCLNLKGVVLGQNTERMAILTENEMTGEHTLALCTLPNAKTERQIPYPRFNLSEILFAKSDDYILASMEVPAQPSVKIFTCIYEFQTGNMLQQIDGIHVKFIQQITPEHPCFAAHRIHVDENGKESWEFAVVDIETGKTESSFRPPPSSILSVGEAARYGIDRHRWVYDIKEGRKCFQFDPDTDYQEIRPSSRSCPKMTKDENYAIWLHLGENLLMVGDMKTQKVISVCPIHSVPMNLEVTPSRVILIGCEDGRIMMVQIVHEGSGKQILPQVFKRSLRAKDSVLRTLKGASQPKPKSNGVKKSSACQLL